MQPNIVKLTQAPNVKQAFLNIQQVGKLEVDRPQSGHERIDKIIVIVNKEKVG